MIEILGERRRQNGEAGIIRECLFRRGSLGRSRLQILTETGEIGTDLCRSGILDRNLRCRLNPLRIRQGSRGIAAILGPASPPRIKARLRPFEQFDGVLPAAVCTGHQSFNIIGTGTLRPGHRAVARFCKGSCRRTPAVGIHEAFGEGEPIFRRAGFRGQGLDSGALGLELPVLQGCRRQVDEHLAHRHVEQHLLAIIGADEHEFRRRLADRRHCPFALADRHGSLRVLELDDAFEHDERGLARAVHRQGPVGAADRRDRRWCLDVDTRAAAGRAGPDIAALEAELGRVGRPARHVVDRQGRVAADADLGLIVEQDRQVADGIGPQGIAADEALLKLGGPPEILADEPHLLATLGCHDGARSGRLARQGGLGLSVAKRECQDACGGQKTEGSERHGRPARSKGYLL